MDWITGIQKAIDYVEEHLTEPINYEEVAKRVYSSSEHLNLLLRRNAFRKTRSLPLLKLQTFGQNAVKTEPSTIS